MKLPTIHLNGTSAESLYETNIAAVKALHNALTLLHEANPNARDYYPQGNGVIADAMSEHDARVKTLRKVLGELHAICAHIEEAKGGRFIR